MSHNYVSHALITPIFVFLNEIRHIYDLLKILLSMTHKYESLWQAEENSINPLSLSNTVLLIQCESPITKFSVNRKYDVFRSKKRKLG